MSYNTKALLTDVNGKPIPQYYDVATDSFLPMSNAVQLSGSITPTHTIVAVGTSSTSALAANPTRKYLLLVNDSDTNMYVNFSGAAINGQGIRINANGGSLEFGPEKIIKTAITAINNVGTKSLLVTEGV